MNLIDIPGIPGTFFVSPFHEATLLKPICSDHEGVGYTSGAVERWRPKHYVDVHATSLEREGFQRVNYPTLKGEPNGTN